MPGTDRSLVVLTGVTRGLGRAMVDELIRLGHVVAGCGRSEDRIAKLRTSHSNPSEFAVVDVSDAEQVARWADGVLDRLGPPDYLVNNAALISPNARLWELPAEAFDPVVDVNIKGVANVIRAFVPAMVDRGSGVIVNFSSYWGRSVAAEVAPYCASKWAIEGLTQALARELPPGMAAVPLNPGVIDTDMLRSCFGDSAAGHIEPEEWARVSVPFLLGLGPKQNGQPVTVPGQ